MLKNNRGFSFIELLVAVTFISICLVVVTNTYRVSLYAAGISDKYLTSVYLAQNKMEEIRMKGIFENGTKTGKFSKEYKGFSWRTVISPTSGKNLKKISVTIFFVDRNRKNSYNVVTCVFKASENK